MRNEDRADIVPLSELAPSVPWIYYPLSDGEDVGSTTVTARNMAWGSAAVAAPSLSYIPAAAGTIWTATRGRCEFPDNGSNSLLAADLDAVTAAAFSFAGSGVLLAWAHVRFDTDGTDTGTHTVLQLGNGGNSKPGFELQIQQSLGRMQTYGRVDAAVSEALFQVGTSSAMSAGTDATIACVLDFGTLGAYGYVNAVQSGTMGTLPSGSLTLNAADSANRIAIGGSYSAGSPATARLFDGAIQRVGLMRFASMPSNMEDLIAELAARKGVPGRKLLSV